MVEACRIRAPGGDTEALLQVAAQLYQIQGRYDLALAIYLRQQQPAVFDFIQEHHLLPVLHERVAQLLSIDEERATQLLMDQYDEVPASTVVPSIQVGLPPAQTRPVSHVRGHHACAFLCCFIHSFTFAPMRLSMPACIHPAHVGIQGHSRQPCMGALIRSCRRAGCAVSCCAVFKTMP